MYSVSFGVKKLLQEPRRVQPVKACEKPADRPASPQWEGLNGGKSQEFEAVLRWTILRGRL